MIGRNPWTSESQESYVDYHQNCIEVNEEVLGKIENYISERQPQVKSPPKAKKGERKVAASQDKKENRYNPAHYQSPKADRKGEAHLEAFKNNRGSGEGQKSHNKLNCKEDGKGESKYSSQHKQILNKTYALGKSGGEVREFTENEQEKLIEKVSIA
jgi:hypothetical protein